MDEKSNSSLPLWGMVTDFKKSDCYGVPAPSPSAYVTFIYITFCVQFGWAC